MAEEDDAAPPSKPLAEFDAAWLLAKLRTPGEDRDVIVREAYRRTFHTEVGRIVLLHHLQACGVGRTFGHDQTDAQLRYSVGLHDAAVMLANDAGFDEAALAVTLLTQELMEDRDNEMGTPAHLAAQDDNY